MYSLSKEESERIKIIKFISIIFVVYIHSYATSVNFSDGADALYLPLWLKTFEDCLSQVIARCGVPIFFLLSAILLFKSERPYLPTLKKKAKTLLLPYMIWNTFWIVVFIILQSLPFTGAYFSGSHTPILQCTAEEWLELYGIGKKLFGSETLCPQCYPLWFMRDLMVALLIYPIIKKVTFKYPRFMACIGIFMVVIPTYLPFKTALAWFIIGAAIVKLDIHLNALDTVPTWKVTIVYLIGAFISLFFEVSIMRNMFILIGVLFWARISKEIYIRKKIREKILWLSNWTFIIYVFHELSLSSVKKLCVRLLPATPAFLFVEYAFLPVLIVICCIILGCFMKRICPKAYAVVTGER